MGVDKNDSPSSTVKFGVFAQLLAVMSGPDRTRLSRLTALAVVGALLEAFGVGVVVPCLALITSPDWLQSQPWLESVLPSGISGDSGRLVGFVLVFLVTVAAGRTAFLTWLAFVQTRFAAAFEVELSTRLLERYLAKPWMFHLQHNSAELVRNIRHEASTVGFVVGACMTVIIEAAMLAAIVVLLLWMQPLPTIAMGLILGGIGFAYQRVMHARVARWGALRMKFEGGRIQQLQQGLGAVRELRLARAAATFAQRYRCETEAHLSTVQRHTFASQLPRLVFDLLAVLALASALAVMLVMGAQPEGLLPVIGLFGAAAIRLLPSVNKLLGALQLIRWGTPSVRVIFEEISGTIPATATMESGSELPEGDIVVAGVSFCYPGSQSYALEGVNMRIRQGSATGIIGKSGSGKSTLLDVLLGLLEPDEGSVQVGGQDIQSRISSWHRRIGYVPQSIYLFDESLRRNIAIGVPEEAIDDAAIASAIRSANLEELVASWPEGTSTKLGERGVRLSGGQRQRIGIARALYSNPPVIVLDEATSALDVDTESAVMDSIFGLLGSKTIVVVAHRLSTVERCDQLYRLEGGKVVASGTFEEVVES